MKNFIGLVAGILFFFSLQSYSQDSLSVEILKKTTTHFKINNNTFSQEGLSFIENEIRLNQFILIGEYHGSKQISKFTNAILPIFKENGGDFFGLETGPNSAKILQELSLKPEETIANLKELNSNYSFEYSRGTHTPIPFFSNVSDAEFLETASTHKLKLIGLDQEFKFGLVLLMEKMFSTLTKKEQSNLRTDYEQAMDTLEVYYTKEFDYYDKRTDEKKRFAILMKQSKYINHYLDKMSVTNAYNQNVVENIRKSIDIYWKASIREYWEGNKLRTENFIFNLMNELEKNHFDMKNDKMLIKIGGIHSAKGLNNYSMYDIGNSIYELARLNNKRSLHTVFLDRFSKDENGAITDAMDNTDSWYYRSFKDFFQMGKVDEWTIIDLRPLRDDVYYQKKFLMSESAKEYFNRYDLVIITPLEEAPTLNADL